MDHFIWLSRQEHRIYLNIMIMSHEVCYPHLWCPSRLRAFSQQSISFVPVTQGLPTGPGMPPKSKNKSHSTSPSLLSTYDHTAPVIDVVVSFRKYLAENTAHAMPHRSEEHPALHNGNASVQFQGPMKRYVCCSSLDARGIMLQTERTFCNLKHNLCFCTSIQDNASLRIM